MSTTVSRRTKRYPIPPPPSPKILNFPRRRQTRRRKHTKPTTHLHPQINPLQLHQQYLSHKGRLETLFNQENEPPAVLLNSTLDSSVINRRERVEEEDKELNFDVNGGFEEEKWRFQADILRAECNFLRIEREFALKKLEKNRVKMEKTLKSAVQTLVSGKKKIFEGKSVNIVVLEEEIEDLVEKLEELQKSSRGKDSVVRNCSNFDKKACVLQCRFEKLGGLSDHYFVNEWQEIVPESNLCVDMSKDIDKQNSHSSSQIEYQSTDVELLKKKMEGMLDRVEVYGSMLSSTANSSGASSASTSKRIDQSFSGFSTRQFYQEQLLHDQENKCSGRCKAIVRRIVEQVRAETEQWSQMQEMLGQVRGEMEELQVSRDFWENRAHNSDYEVQSLKHDVEEWKETALRFELKSNELQNELIVLKENHRKAKEDFPLATLGKQLQKEKLVSSCRFKEKREFDESRCKVKNAMEELNMEEIKERTKISQTLPISLGKQLAKEKRMFLLSRFKENRCTSEVGCKEEVVANKGRTKAKRSPLRDIENSSCLARENGRAGFSYYSPEKYKTREIFRKS